MRLDIYVINIIVYFYYGVFLLDSLIIEEKRNYLKAA